MTKLVSVDLETTGLDPQRHEVWDVGIIVFDSDNKDAYESHQWFLPVELKTAEPMALKVGKFYERHPWFQQDAKENIWGDELELQGKIRSITNGDVVSLAWASHKIARLVDGGHLVGNVVSFDAAFLNKFMRDNGAAPTWHYHLVDCEALVAGALGLVPPWKSREMSMAIGVEPPSEADAHSALTDAKWSYDLYWAAMERYSDNDQKRAPEGNGWSPVVLG